ncbi:MAG: dephospho-CoA kinase [Erysipelotrichaceae bacterium]|nr:dephospho-CoA kinase [Erysipelotrichaceae bacterium]
MQTLSKKKIAITGSMGSGKSRASQFVREAGLPVLDLDRVNAELLQPDHKGYDCLKKEGLIRLDPQGNIDKKQLAQAMFEDDSVKEKVEAILHPLIIEEMNRWIDAQITDLVFVEVPLLFESHMDTLFDRIWCVVVSQQKAVERLVRYRGFTKQEALARLEHQMSVKEKMERSDVVLYNEGNLEELKQAVSDALRKEKG